MGGVISTSGVSVHCTVFVGECGTVAGAVVVALYTVQCTDTPEAETTHSHYASCMSCTVFVGECGMGQ